MGRRDFLRKSGIAAAGGFAALTLGFGKKAQAGEYSTENLPPGFANSPFGKVREAASMLNLGGTNKPDNELEPYFYGTIVSGGRIGFLTPDYVHLLDPAYYMIIHLNNYKSGSFHGLSKIPDWGLHGESELRNKNPALAFFVYGLIMYFDRWVYGKNVNERDMENNFLKAIFIAGEKGPYPTGVQSGAQKANDFQNSLYAFTGDWENFNFTFPGERESAVDGLMQSLNQISSNQGNLDPNEGYYRKLVAAWSSFFLANQYWSKVKEANDDSHQKMQLVQKSIEIPLRKFYRVRSTNNEQKYFDNGLI